MIWKPSECGGPGPLEAVAPRKEIIIIIIIIIDDQYKS